MKILLRHLVALVFLIQSLNLPVYALTEGEEQICNQCVDRNLEPGTKIERDGRFWELLGIETVKGEPMWRARETEDWSEGPGVGGSIDKGDRLTHGNFAGFEDNANYSKRDREELQKVQQKILHRLNEETRGDTEATNKELESQLAGLNQAVQDAGTIAYRGADLSLPSTDPVQALQDSLNVQPGNGSLSIEQTGWQPFDDREYQSSHKAELEELRDRLNYSVSKTPQQADAKKAGYGVLAEVDKAYVTQDNGLGNSLLRVAKVLVDIATDVIPLTSIPKDFYRAFVGKDPMTGESLANWERSLAGGFFIAGMATMGGSNLGKSWIKALAKGAKLTPEAAVNGVRAAKALEKAPRSVVALIKDSLDNLRLLNPVKENALLREQRGYTQAAWSERKIIFRGNTKAPTTLVRFYNPGSSKRVGSWVTSLEQVKGKSPEEIKLLLGLPEAPTHFTIAELPKGTDVSIGFVSPNKWGGDPKALQYFVIDPKNSFFGNVRSIGNLFKGIK